MEICPPASCGAWVFEREIGRRIKEVGQRREGKKIWVVHEFPFPPFAPFGNWENGEG